MAHVWSSKTIEATDLADLYEWLDIVPLSRQRNNVEKDFSDGVLAAEIVKFYFPDLVDIREFRSCQNVQERIAQWKELNNKMFRKIGMNIPTHVMTQLSIAKTGIAQIFLNNLRTCLTLFGANTLVRPLPVYPATLPQVDPWYRYQYVNGRRVVGPNYTFPDDYEYYWQKKQAQRALKSARKSIVPGAIPTGTIVVPPKAVSDPTLRSRSRGSVFPPLGSTAYLPPNTPFSVIAPPPLPANTRLGAASRLGAAAKLELDEKNQMLYDKTDEVQFLRGQLKRMEIVLQNKNFKIQELQAQIEKLKTPKLKY